MEPARVVLFMDYQNVYFGAREAFHELHAPNTDGHVTPLKLGELLVQRSPYPRVLTEVRVYRGQPDSTKDPTGYGANFRQVSTWSQMPKTVTITRTLRYPHGWPKHAKPGEKAQEKGVDVAIAVDYVTMAERGQYDVGIIMSGDTDLKPALEAVVAMDGQPYPRAEVAAWSSSVGHSRRLAISGAKLWCPGWTRRPTSLVGTSRTTSQ